MVGSASMLNAWGCKVQAMDEKWTEIAFLEVFSLQQLLASSSSGPISGAIGSYPCLLFVQSKTADHWQFTLLAMCVT